MENNAYVLVHHGVRGMKWGIRRYQNKDGSLTPAGKKRLAKLDAEREQLAGKKKVSSTDSAPVKKQKGIEEFTDDELVSKTNRMRLEQQYLNAKAERGRSDKAAKDSNLADDSLKAKTAKLNEQIEYLTAQKRLSELQPEQVSKGKAFIQSLTNDVLVPAAKNVGREYLEKTLKDALGLKKADTESVFDKMKKESEYYVNQNKKEAAQEQIKKRKKEAEQAEKQEREAAKKAERDTTESAKEQKVAEKQAKKETHKEQKARNVDNYESVTAWNKMVDDYYNNRATGATKVSDIDEATVSVGRSEMDEILRRRRALPG